MKKIFTLIAAAFMAASANAQVTEWNFSDWEQGDISETMTKDGLTVYANSDKKISIDSNKKTVDGVTYTQRLKFGGTGGWEETTPTGRVLGFTAEGPCTIEIVVAHASSSGDPRTLMVTDANKDEIGNISVEPSEIKKGAINYTGQGGKIYIYSANSGLNLYDIKVTNSTTDAINNATINTTNNGAIYNLAGQQVSSNYKGLIIRNGKKVLVK